jgi:hypothetical protein
MCEREWEVFLRLEMKFCACSAMGKSVGGVYKGAPKSWWPLGKSDWKTVEPVLKPVESDSTRGFSVHWRTQPETGPAANPVEPGQNSVEPVEPGQNSVAMVANPVEPGQNSVEPFFQKSAHDFFWQDWLADWQVRQWQRGTVQKPVEPVLIPVEPIFETFAQILRKLKWNKGKMKVLDQGFWALVPTPTYSLWIPLDSTTIPILKLDKI